MFTGIIEALGKVVRLEQDRANLHITIASSISDELKIDQSVSHNGVCLTVVALEPGAHTVTAVDETLRRSNLGDWQAGSLVNLERSMALGGRLDGHMVQGHVDATATCIDVEEAGGSWRFTFRYQPTPEHLLVDKGSVAVNGVSRSPRRSMPSWLKARIALPVDVACIAHRDPTLPPAATR